LRRLLTGVLAAFALLIFTSTANRLPRFVGHIDTRILGDLVPGDVVFVTLPDAFWAIIACATSLRSYRHGHVGMIVDVGPKGAYVVDASGNPSQEDAVVVREPLESFAQGASAIDVFRPTDPQAARVAAETARAYARERLGFDSGFSLDSKERLYCSELVWRALSKGFGRDIIPVKSRLAGRDAILLSDLETSRYLKPFSTSRSSVAMASNAH
jgi:hypothetical protein